MQTEEIILHSLRIIFAIGMAVKACLIWTYLNKNALGMQTILDQMVKDIIIIHGMTFISTNLALMKIVENPYNHYVALTIMIFHCFFALAIFWQIFVTVVIRYLSVFHHNMLNSVDEISVFMTTRKFVGLVSLISTLWEVYDYEHQFIYIFLINSDIDTEVISRFKPFLIVLIVNIITLLFVQIRIEIFKKTVDQQNESSPPVESPDEENQNCLEMAFEYSHNTIRIVLFIIFLVLMVVLGWMLNTTGEMQEIVDDRLRIHVCMQFILTNVIPMILIKRNPNMYKYCVKQIQCI